MPCANSTNKKKSRVRLVTFREMREIQRMMETAKLGPGSTDCSKPFGADIKQRVIFGRRHQIASKMDNPGPGAYNY